MSRDWRNQFPSRRGIFLIGGGVVMLGLTARLAELQLFRQQEFEAKGKETRIRLEPAPAHRGTIYDRGGRVLAGSKRNFYVTIQPELAGDAREISDILDRMGRIFTLSEQKKRSIKQEAATGARFRPILVADDLTWQEFAKVNAMAPELNGVVAEVGELRSYPLQGAFFHTIGFVAKADESAIMAMIEKENNAAGDSPDSPAGIQRASTIKRLYKHPAMRVGKQGIEKFGETQLKGEPGKIRVLQNATGRVIERLDSKDLAGTPGTDVVLTLDAELQNYAISRFGTESGSCIVIDVVTGQVLCMMSTPAPDPNAFVSGIGSALYKSYQDDERVPMLHKAYEGVYPPGSTFKIVVACAAIESGIVKPEDKVHCSGGAFYYDHTYHCWESKGHGWMNLHTGLQKSCDCYFYEIARRTGIEKIAEMAKQFGIQHRYELGLTGGKMGVAPNDAWKRADPRIKQPWYPGDTISAAIGQGYVLTTPFEMAVMCQRIAGGHATPNPYMVASGFTVPDQTITPLGAVSEKTLELVRAGMYAVTSEPGGTAIRQGALDEKNELPAPYTGARMAGKSGSAQVRKIQASDRNASGKAKHFTEYEWAAREHAHFVAYAPADKPRYAVAITVEHGGSGSSVAAPFAKDILAHCLKYDPGNKKPFVPTKQEVAGNPAVPS